MLYLISNMLFQVDVAFIGRGVLFFVRSEVNKQKLKQLCHNSKQLIVEVIVEFVVELFIGRFSQGLNNVINALTYQILDFVVIFRISISCVDIGHEMDE